ncbi:MAG: SDR family oxidoreductase [Bacteroidia bacterium]
MSNKTIWITGAGSGIGKALVHAYAESGNSIILSGRNSETLEEAAAEVANKDCSTYCLVLNVSIEEKIAPAVASMIEKYGKIDLLINNAGISQRSLVKDTSNEVGKVIMDVNFFGTVHLTKAILPHMLNSNSGDIVVISSAAGKFGFTRRSYYSASKHALHGFFDALSIELHQTNLNVLLVCPGRIQTKLSVSALTGDGSTFNKNDHRLEGGISAEKCANIIKRAITKRKKEIYLGGQEVLMIYIKRFIPALFRFIAPRVKAE